MIRIWSFEVYYWRTVPSGVSILLALCNFPKAVMAVTEATSKPLRFLDLALQYSERDPSLSLGSIPPRLKERSLSESWRARSKTQSGFDVASMNAITALGKLQSANTIDKDSFLVTV
jgi:hypothetical protein